LQLFNRNLDRDVAIVAEIGVNHEGDVRAAERLVDLATESGVDAVKLQTYTPARYASASDPERLERVGRFCLDDEAQRHLKAHATKRGIPLFSTALTEDVVPFLAEWSPAIKIASGDLNFEPVIRAACATGKPVIISTGNGTIEEIDDAVAWCRDVLGDRLLPDRLVLMHCVSAYPTPIEQANVLSVPYLKQRYGLTIGYSNHVIETEAVLAAVALGAQVVEVHMTDQRSGRKFRDHALSLEPAELRALVDSIRRVKDSLGRPGKAVQECERPLREIMRKGVVAARNLDAGTVLAQDDLMFARPAVHIPASEMPRLLGRTLVRAVRHGESILREDLR
jgi:N-acetylneuraminate synthase/N,N'-diacetyllegionaminate synthase